jgi:hypothetical protein
MTYVSPQEAVPVYEHNARLVQRNFTGGFREYPVGTVLAMASFDEAGVLAAARTIGGEAPAPQASASAVSSNPCAARVNSANPCNARVGAGQASNPCNPGAVRGKPLNPSNPCAAQDRPGARPGPSRIAAAFGASETTPAPTGFVPGPVFFMRKELPGYDSEGGDWRYAATDPALRITIGEGHAGPVQFCKECHSSVKGRGFVFAGGGS